MKIKNIQIQSNNNEKTKEIRNKVEQMLKIKFNIVEEKPDLVIAIGGDGVFINSVRSNNFDKQPLYVGIHTGHLGFLQEVDIADIDKLFVAIVNETFKVEELNLEQIEIFTENEVKSFLALNEITVKEKSSNTLHLNVLVNNKHLEDFSGDGIIVSTPTGSTAYNKSAGGSIIYPSLKTLQITPLAPISSKAYRSLDCGVVVPEDTTVSLIPEEYHRNSTKIAVDGEEFLFHYVKKINVTTAKEGIKVLRFEHYDFWTRVNDKFL